MKKCIFKKLQDRHKFCIVKIILFAYDYLFEQQRNSHDEYLMDKNLLNKRVISNGKSTSKQGAWHDHCPSSRAVKSRFGESLKCQIARGRPPSGSLGALDDQTKIFW